MIFAEDIRKTILLLADEKGPGRSFGPSEIAKRVRQEASPALLEQVWVVASVLVKEGKITAMATSEQTEPMRSLRFQKASRI
jgi:hypothetical protein